MTLSELVRLTLAEDIGPGDLTTNTTVLAEQRGTARIIAKEELVLSGLDAAAEVFGQLGATLRRVAAEGQTLSAGAVVATVEGPLRSLLSGERAALNFLMHLSGVATHTRRVVAVSAVKVVDTRKSTPLLRQLEKAAVRAGGAFNHRFALFDGILIKDNHIVAAGGLTTAVKRARAGAHHLLRIEVEVESLTELEEALAAGADVVLLDNMDDDTLREAVRINAGRAILEASGNMTAERVARLGDVGIDFVSMGGLIHQSRWVDLSMRIDPVA